MKISMVVPTLGRSREFLPLLESLAGMGVDGLELIIVDQNGDDRLVPVLAARDWPFELIHMRTPAERGISRARNAGWREARGEVILFPDDDCWYPAWFVERALAVMDETGADIVAGRAAAADGRPINGRYLAEPKWIGRGNVFETQIEWVVFFRRRVLEAVGGYSEEMGVGAASPWQACEGQDIMLRALDAGFKAYFDPSIFGYHAELDIYRPDAAMRRKGRGYARGMGAVLRRHDFPIGAVLRWLARPAAHAMIRLALLDPPRARYYANVTVGRLEGYAGRVFDGTGKASGRR